MADTGAVPAEPDGPVWAGDGTGTKPGKLPGGPSEVWPGGGCGTRGGSGPAGGNGPGRAGSGSMPAEGCGGAGAANEVGGAGGAGGADVGGADTGCDGAGGADIGGGDMGGGDAGAGTDAVARTAGGLPTCGVAAAPSSVSDGWDWSDVMRASCWSDPCDRSRRGTDMAEPLPRFVGTNPEVTTR
ncbi:hypothetical protein GCM10010399_42630 [Dactylosporangium fulvum]